MDKLTRCVLSWATNRWRNARCFAENSFRTTDWVLIRTLLRHAVFLRRWNHISSISARSSSLVLPTLFSRRPRSSSSLPSANIRSSSVSWPYFCLSLPLTSFQLPFICSFITNDSCIRDRAVLLQFSSSRRLKRKKTVLTARRLAESQSVDFRLDLDHTTLVFLAPQHLFLCPRIQFLASS